MKEEILSKDEYYKKLEHWVNQAKLLQNATACFPYYLAANYPNYFSLNGVNIDGSSISTTSPLSGTTNPIPNPPTNAERIRLSNLQNASNQDEGYEFVIAPLWKRFVAEMVDVSILLLLKVAITFTFLNIFDLDLSYEFDSDYLRKTVNDSDTKFLSIADLLSLSSDLVALEILMKIFVCLYEAVWTMNGRVIVGGATPGKLLLRLRIVYVEMLTVRLDEPADLNGTGPVRAIMYPASNPGFRRAFCRALAKNLVLALLFPVCFVFLFLKNNRTFYDVFTKTVVVEENPSPQRRSR
ncbi:protein FAM8A1 [Episyrphus balteatus]|uniref:protein FAM8A1 n=1 Tax=Episyrphus balteatus TaxID=286459 RepID=UPI002486C5DA|nr:protein FAM8A1 [Episyrphus balteatus]